MMLPRGAVDVPVLEVFRAEWGSEQSGLVEGVPARGRGLECDGL